MKINLRQAIAENWSMTIPAWCQALDIGKQQRQMLQQYHREYIDRTLNCRLGRPMNPQAERPVWVLTHDEFRTLQKYRARMAQNHGWPKGKKRAKKSE